MSLIRQVHAILQDEGIKHALIGAAALAIHGYNRATADIDLLTTSWAPLDPGFWPDQEGPEVEVRRGDDEDPLAGVVVLRRGDEIVDLVVGRGRWLGELLDRAIGTGPVPLVTLPDLVLLKLHAGGVRDRRDIEEVLPLMTSDQISEVEAHLHLLTDWSREHWTRLRR